MFVRGVVRFFTATLAQGQRRAARATKLPPVSGVGRLQRLLGPSAEECLGPTGCTALLATAELRPVRRTTIVPRTNEACNCTGNEKFWVAN